MDLPSVREANTLNSNCALLCKAAHMLGITWLIEQPATSLFFDTPLMKEAIQLSVARPALHTYARKQTGKQICVDQQYRMQHSMAGRS